VHVSDKYFMTVFDRKSFFIGVIFAEDAYSRPVADSGNAICRHNSKRVQVNYKLLAAYHCEKLLQ